MREEEFLRCQNYEGGSNPSISGNLILKTNPAEKIEKWDIEKLSPYSRNARTHSEAQIEQICSSIKEWGWTIPVLIDPEGQIIAGHGRIEAARKMGMTEVPVMVADGWTEVQKQKYVLADNKIALNAGWDQGLLRAEIEDLKAVTDLELTGFSTFELSDILGLNPPEQKSTTKEVDSDSFEMDHKCPKCGFEFDA